MAWSSEALASYETARAALDKPLIAAQAIPISPAYKKWVDAEQVSEDDISTWTDRSASANPSYFAYDGYPGYITKRGAQADDVYYYALDLGAPVEFDCAFLIGHNAGTLSLVNDLVLQVAGNNAFTENLTTVGNFGKPTDDGRLADLELAVGGVAHRITAQYVWLKWDKTGTNITPEIGELILGRRRQLEYKPQRGYDDEAMSEEAEVIDTMGGIHHKTLYSRRGFELNGKFLVDSTTYRDDLVQFFRDCHGPFVWIENPNSAPDSWHFMLRSGAFQLPRIVANLREHQIAAVEQGPEAYYLDVEEHG